MSGPEGAPVELDVALGKVSSTVFLSCLCLMVCGFLGRGHRGAAAGLCAHVGPWGSACGARCGTRQGEGMSSLTILWLIDVSNA
jgi:hypothetical protein